MLLPAKFQTPAPETLGRKIVAIAPAPKPHAHQWVSVPDSKIHSRCAECGTVTLTEIVAPKVVAFADAMQAMVMASPKPTFAELCAGEEEGERRRVAYEQALITGSAWIAVDLAVPGSDRTVFSETFLGKPYSGTATEIVAPKVVAFADAMQALITDIGEAFRKSQPTPTRHYTLITAPDGKVRMVETDAEGWIKNDGAQPVADDVRVEVRFADTEYANMTYSAKTFVWKCVSHWRPAA